MEKVCEKEIGGGGGGGGGREWSRNEGEGVEKVCEKEIGGGGGVEQE